MPIYEYQCNHCQTRFIRLILNSKEAAEVRCSSCNSVDLIKLLSCFAIHETEASRLSKLDTIRPQREELYKDSRNIGLWAKKRMKESGINSSQLDDFIETSRSKGGKLLDEYYEKQRSDK